MHIQLMTVIDLLPSLGLDFVIDMKSVPFSMFIHTVL